MVYPRYCIAKYVLSMSVTTKAIRYHFITIGAILAIEIAIISVAIYFDEMVFLIVLGPLTLFLAILLWVNIVTGIRCPKCHNIYGVSLGSHGWPSVPSKCLICGHTGK